MRIAILNRAVTLFVLALTGLALVVGSAALRAGAADHLDAPSLGSLSVGSLKGDRDINDVYVFAGRDHRTVLVMTTNPAVNVPSIDPFGTYGNRIQYRLNIDNDGDFVQDVSLVTTFRKPDANGVQRFTVRLYTGADAVATSGDGDEVASGDTGQTKGTTGEDGMKAFAGERSDPFFFDLLAFRGQLGIDPLSTQRFCSLAPDPDTDGTGTDFFAALNTLAIVLEVPDDWLGGSINVWADTRQKVGGTWTIVDQMGRPAINTVFNGGADKETFNTTPPSMQDDGGQPYRGNVSAVLQALGGYDMPTADFVATLLIPDVIPYDTSSSGTDIFNGRALADDVIDTELSIVTGAPGPPDIPGDCVGPHTDYQSKFPYLGKPH